jgi:hypothetical protein
MNDVLSSSKTASEDLRSSCKVFSEFFAEMTDEARLPESDSRLRPPREGFDRFVLELAPGVIAVLFHSRRNFWSRNPVTLEGLISRRPGASSAPEIADRAVFRS